MWYCTTYFKIKIVCFEQTLYLCIIFPLICSPPSVTPCVTCFSSRALHSAPANSWATAASATSEMITAHNPTQPNHHPSPKRWSAITEHLRQTLHHHYRQQHRRLRQRSRMTYPDMWIWCRIRWRKAGRCTRPKTVDCITASEFNVLRTVYIFNCLCMRYSIPNRSPLYIYIYIWNILFQKGEYRLDTSDIYNILTYYSFQKLNKHVYLKY